MPKSSSASVTAPAPAVAHVNAREVQSAQQNRRAADGVERDDPDQPPARLHPVHTLAEDPHLSEIPN